MTDESVTKTDFVCAAADCKLISSFKHPFMNYVKGLARFPGKNDSKRGEDVTAVEEMLSGRFENKLLC